MYLWRHLAPKIRKYNETKQTGYAGDLNKSGVEWKEKTQVDNKKKQEEHKHTLEVSK